MVAAGVVPAGTHAGRTVAAEDRPNVGSEAFIGTAEAPHGSRVAISDDPFAVTIRPRIVGARGVGAGDLPGSVASHFVAGDFAGEDFLAATLIPVVLDHRTAGAFPPSRGRCGGNEKDGNYCGEGRLREHREQDIPQRRFYEGIKDVYRSLQVPSDAPSMMAVAFGQLPRAKEIGSEPTKKTP